MGQTQFSVGTANVRASCILLLATGNVGGFGNGANIFRGHCNVQGATDLGLDVTSLPLYYGLADGAWKHWCRVWEVDYDWISSRFDVQTASDGKPVKMMETSGIPSTRWFDATLLPKDQVSQKDNLKAMVVFGHGGNTVTRMPEAAKRHRKARSAGRRRSASDHLGGAQRAQGQHLPAADLHAVRNVGLAHRLEPLAPVGRADRQADLPVQGRLRGDVSAGEEARLRRPDVQEHQGRTAPSRCPRTSCARSTAAAGRPAIAGNRRSGSSSTWRTRRISTSSPCGPRMVRPRAIITACRGRAGARRNSAIPAPTRSTTPICTSRTAAARSGRGSGSSAKSRDLTAPPSRSTCSPKAPTRSARRSRTAIRNSPMGCSRSSAGTRT